MIKIFNANDRDFSTAGNIIIKPIKCNEIKKKSLNGWYIEVEVPIKYKDYISKDKLCVVKTKSKLNPQAFRIGEEINYTTRKIKFKAEHVMFDAKDYTLIDVRPTNQNGLNALNYINQRTDDNSPFTIYSNVENINTAYFIRKNLLEAWAIIEERWGGVFDADNWNISFLMSVGNDNGETIAYGKNMQGFDIFEDWSSVCTKLCPVGYDGLMLPEQFLTSDVKYEKPYTRIIDFQTDLESEDQTEENLLAELRTKGEAYLEENKVPKVSYTIVSNINGNLEIGDTIKVLHPFVNIFTEVLEYEYNLISQKVVSLTFGNYSRDVKTKFENIKNTIEQVNQAISKQEVVINNQTNLINSLNKNGYVYIDENEILLLDAIPKEKAKNVWRFGLAGIGFSSNGYEGPFEVAMTMDGQINANFITTGTMSVSRIEGLANFISETEKQIAEIEIEQGNITSRVSSLETTAENLQAQIDGSIQFWNGSEIPTVSNYPANEWTTEEAKNNHRADIYTVIEDVDGELKQGKSYRFDKVGDTWQWIELTDNELSAVQALATSKAKVFVTTPTVPYNVGDLWINGGKLYRCKTAKDNNGTYSESDWEEAVDYTDDTVANLAKTLANNAQSTADSAVEGVNNITNTQGEAEGKSIHIEDSAEEPFVDVELYGESVQEETPTPDSPSEIENVEGRNKFSGFVKGIAINSTDGHQLADETRASSDYIAVDFNQNPNYYLSGLANTLQTFVAAYNSNKEFLGRTGAMLVSYFSLNSSSFTGGTAQGTGDIAYLRVTTYENTAGGTTGAIDDVDNLETQLEKGTVATPYVPYNSLEFKVEGKNIFNKNDIHELNANLNNGNITSANAERTLWMKCKPNTTYSFKKLVNSPYGRNMIAESDTVPAIGGTCTILKTYTSSEILTVTTSSTAKYLLWWYYNTSSTNYTKQEILDSMQIEENTESTTYEPYKSQVATFPLGEGEKLYQGSFLNDNGKNHTRKQVIFDGSEGWKDSYYDTYGFFYIALTDKAYGKTNLICSHFKTSEDETKYSDVVNGRNNNTNICFYPNTSIATTLAEWKAYLAEQYANGTPVILEYELAEPETVPYTEEQQESWNNIKALMTYKNVTNITSTAYAKVTYMRDNGLDVYETKQNAQKKYTETSEKLTEQKITVDGVITQVSDITSKTDELTGEVKTINSEISTVKQTIEGWSSELKNTGGNNIFYYSLDFWDNSNGLEEYSDTEIMQNSISQNGYVLNNGSAKQTQSVKNGFYTCSFNYKKLLELAVCQVKINGTTYDLTETDWVEFEQAFEVKTNKIEIEFIGDTDNSLYISDLMVNVGTTKLSWSQNANETRTDTVTIGKGIQVNSSAKNTYHRIDADGNRTFNKTTGKVVNEATDKGTETEELVVRGQAKITGLLIQKVSDQVWINSLL